MRVNESFQAFIRSVNQQMDRLRQSMSDLLKTISLEDRDRKVEAAKILISRIDDLKRTLSSNDFPVWAPIIETRLNWYIQNVRHVESAGQELLNAIVEVQPLIAKHEWNFESDDGQAIDFPAIYEECYRSSRLPELFDQLVKQLEELIESGEIDSTKSTNALRNLIATIKKNSRKDQYSTMATWHVIGVLLANIGLQSLEDIPAISTVVKAIRTTMEELNIEVPNVCRTIRVKVAAAATRIFPMLTLNQLALPSNIDGVDAIENVDTIQEPNNNNVVDRCFG